MKKFAFAILCLGMFAACTTTDKAKDNEATKTDAVEATTDVKDDATKSSEASETTEATDETAATDADGMIGSYQKLIADLTAAIEKAKSGDATAIASLTPYVEKLKDLATKIKGLKDITPEQLKAFAGLESTAAEKIASVAALASSTSSDALKQVDKAKDALKSLKK